MPRNRVIYNTQALYVSQVKADEMQTDPGEILQLSRVQTFDEDFSRNFIDINQYGNLSSVNRLEVESPTVTASFSYYLTDGFNEKKIGLNVYPIGTSSSNLRTCISGFLTKETDEKNYYLLITDEGNDAAGYIGNNSGVIGIGNGFISSYSINAGVGTIPTAEVEIEGLNIGIYSNLNNNLQAWGFEQLITGDINSNDLGRNLACTSEGDIIVIGATEDNTCISAGGAGLIYTGNKNNGWKFRQKLTGCQNNGRLSRHSINKSGNIITLGAFGNYGFSGSALIYTGNSIDGWTFKQELRPASGTFAADNMPWFGRITKINNSGNVIVVGAQRDDQGGKWAGSLQIFTGNGVNNWSHAQTLTGLRPSGGLTRGAINGDGSIIVGGGYPRATGNGINILDPQPFAIIYTGNPIMGTWAEKQRISGTSTQLYRDGFGISTDISEDGTVIVIGAPYETQGSSTEIYINNPNFVNFGAIYIYTGNTNNGWQFKEKKIATLPNGLFGWNVSISPNTNIIAVGSPGLSSDFLSVQLTNINQSKSYTTIYTGNAINGWNFKQTIGEDDNFSQFGTYTDTSFNGDIIFAGGTRYLNADMSRGAVSVYTLESGSVVPAINPINGSVLSNILFNIPAANALTGMDIPTALNPGDITFTIPTSGTMGFEETDLKIQDFTLSFDLNRTPLQKVGNRFAFSREIDFPVTASLEVNAEVGDLRNGNLVDLLCNETGQNFTIQMKQAGCGTSKPTALAYVFKGAKLVSQNFSSAIGDNATMNATYEVQLGGIQDTTKGIFISGSFQNFNGVKVEGAGAGFSNETYKYNGFYNNRPSYIGMNNDANYILLEGSEWILFDEDRGEPTYRSDSNDVFYPWEAGWYETNSEFFPVPTFTPVNI